MRPNQREDDTIVYAIFGAKQLDATNEWPSAGEQGTEEARRGLWISFELAVCLAVDETFVLTMRVGATGPQGQGVRPFAGCTQRQTVKRDEERHHLLTGQR